MLKFTPPAAVIRERTERLLAERPDAAHLAPPFAAVAEGLGLAIAAQTAEPFRLPENRPVVLVVGDDLDTSLGPDGFHKPSLRRVLRRAAGVAVMAGAPRPEPYALAAEAALTFGATMVLIECREITEGDWNAFVATAAPRVPRLIVTPFPEHEA